MSFTPTAVTLPPRKNAIQYSDEHISAVADALNAAEIGAGIMVDKGHKTESTARARAKIIRDALLKLNPPVHTRTHTVELTDDTHAPVLSRRNPPVKGEAEDSAETEVNTDAPKSGRRGK